MPTLHLASSYNSSPRSVPRYLSGGTDGGGTDGKAGPALQHLFPTDQPDLQARSDGDTRADQ